MKNLGSQKLREYDLAGDSLTSVSGERRMKQILEAMSRQWPVDRDCV